MLVLLARKTEKCGKNQKIFLELTRDSNNVAVVNNAHALRYHS